MACQFRDRCPGSRSTLPAAGYLAGLAQLGVGGLVYGVGQRALPLVSGVQVDHGGAGRGVAQTVHEFPQVSACVGGKSVPACRRSWIPLMLAISRPGARPGGRRRTLVGVDGRPHTLLSQSMVGPNRGVDDPLALMPAQLLAKADGGAVSKFRLGVPLNPEALPWPTRY